MADASPSPEDDAQPGQDNELTRALTRRRQTVDQHGSLFTKDAAQTTTDASWEEQHDSQFTPRSRRRGGVDAKRATASEAIKDAELEPERVTPEASLPGPAAAPPPAKEPAASPGDAAGGSPAQVPAPSPGPAGLGAEAAPSASPTHSAGSSTTIKSVQVSTTPQVAAVLDATMGICTRPHDVTSISPSTLQGWGSGLHRGDSIDITQPCIAAPSQIWPGNTETFVAMPVRDPDLVWTAVIEGDLRTLEAFLTEGHLTSGRMQDHNGHSVFWNAVAFQQPEVALLVLQHFPPMEMSATGVDLSEVHAKRGDSLLHLCLYHADFSAAAAEVFRGIFRAGEQLQAPRDKVNQYGQTFMHVAAARLNFWVLRFVLSNVPDTVSLFKEKDNSGHTPLELLLRRLHDVAGFLPARPPPMLTPPRMLLPQWSTLPKQIPDGSGSAAPAPFSDLLLEVEDPSAAGGVAQVHAHRVVLAASSRVFHKQLQRTPAGQPLRISPLCCRSSEVLAVALGFLYSGELACTFQEDAFLLWQLLCLCVQYALPEALVVYVRTTLVHTLGTARHAPVVPALLQAADQVGLTSEQGLFAAYVFLSCPQATPGSGFESQAKVFLSALAEVERFALSQHAQQSAGPGSGPFGGR